MYHNKRTDCLFLSSILLILGLFMLIRIGIAQTDSFVLEAEQHWDTYGVGATCISGTHNLAVADVDGDGIREMITGGFSYYMANGTRANFDAPLRIWSWNGQNITLEKSENWPGNIGVVYAADADGDGTVEILTTSFSSLRIWNWNGQDLVLRRSHSGISASSIFVGDVDKDNVPEILAVGRAFNTSQRNAQLSVWQWDGENLSLITSSDWSAIDDIARANSVSAADLDNDGQIEIVTCGYVNSLENCSGQVRVWSFDGNTLSLKASAEWRKVDGYALTVAGNTMGNTIAYHVEVGDVDGDGFSEIVTGGFTYNGDEVEGELRIWNYSENLKLEKSQHWITSDITELKSISINDVDSDGKKEIVTSGVATKYGDWRNETDKEKAELKVWSWNGGTLTLEHNAEWIIGDGVCAWNVGTGDLDNDGVVEITTVGCMYIGTLCDPDLRIWSLAVAFDTSALMLYIVVAIVGIASVVVAGYILLKKRR